MPKSDIVRLQHMLEAAAEAESLIAGKTRADMEIDRLFALACTRLFEIIGEAASQVSPEFKVLYTEVPWSKIIGMRNRLIHAYFDINLDIIWETLINDIPRWSPN